MAATEQREGAPGSPHSGRGATSSAPSAGRARLGRYATSLAPALLVNGAGSRTASSLALVAALLLAGCEREPARLSPEGDAAAAIARRVADSGELMPHDAVAAELARLRRMGPAAAAAGPVLCALLTESAPLYRGRGPNEATRLRGFLIATLADVGPPASALPALREILRLEQSPLVLAAAARAAGTLGPKAAGLAELLGRLSSPGFADDLVALDAYNVLATKDDGTTARAEAGRALELIGGSCCEANEEARCDSRPRPFLVAADDRPPCAIPDIEVETHDGLSSTWAGLFDRPAALCFFYTQCDNPRKCSTTVARMGCLQRAVAAAGLANRARLVLMTLDPAVDSGLVRRRYAELRGFEPSPAAPIVRTSDASLRAVVGALGVNANFGQGRINLHGVEIFLVDHRGRIAGRRGSDWSETEVVKALGQLASETRASTRE